MTFAKFTLAAIAGSLALAQPIPARANNDLGNVILGGAIVCGLTNCLQGKKKSAPVSRGNETVRADQNALNYFGFPAGTADGVSGGKTRTAISNYQGYMGYPITGQLNDWERGNLHMAYNRAQAGGGAVYQNVVAAEGPRGLLKAFEAEGRGQRYEPFGGTGYGTAGIGNGGSNTGGFIPQVPSVVPSYDNGASGNVTASGGLPSFGLVPAKKSMAQHCSSVDILTQANGSLMNANSIVDAGQALDEQFCAARGYAMSRSQQLAANVQGTTDQQLREQCDGLVATMTGQTGALNTQGVSQQIVAATDFAAQFGAPAEQLRSIGEICLGVGYQTDNPDVVIASAMLLVGAGEHAYAEVIGHHLRNGFGTATDPKAAVGWYNAGLAALDSGAAPAFLPSQSAQRAAVIRAALSGKSAALQPVTGATEAGFVLPSFGTQGN